MSDVKGGKPLECPACRFKISEPGDHEPQCPNGDWGRDDVIEYIMKQSAREGERGQGQRTIGEEHALDRAERCGSGWPR